MEALADRLSRYIVSIDAAKEDDREIIAFGIFRFLSTAQQILILLISSIILRAAPGIMLFAAMFGMLKRYAGGAHASRHWTCITVFTSLTYAVYYLCGLIPVRMALYFAAAATVAALVLVLIFAPVTHPNNPKSPERLKRLRKKAVYTASAQAIAVTVCILFAPGHAGLLILRGAMGGFCAAITLILPMPAAEKEVK